MNNLTPLTKDEYAQVLAFVGQAHKELIQYIYEHRVCKVSTILEQFPAHEDEAGVLMHIGTLNGTLWKKFNAAISPVEVASQISDSAYSLGVFKE